MRTTCASPAASVVGMADVAATGETAGRSDAGEGRLRSERGSASVELVGVLPALVVAVLVTAQLAAAGFALWSAGLAARAGARSALIGDDAALSARQALPGLLRDGSEVSDEDAVSVRVLVPRVLPVLPEVMIGARAALAMDDGF